MSVERNSETAGAWPPDASYGGVMDEAFADVPEESIQMPGHVNGLTNGDDVGARMRLPAAWQIGLGAGLVTGIAVALALTARARRDQPNTVPHVDLDRYAGRWFEIARIPNAFQRRCDRDVVVHYTPRPDGRVAVENECVREDGTIDRATAVAKPAAHDESHAKLKVRFAPAAFAFLPFAWGNYWILDLAPDYSWSLVGEPSRRYLWLLSRTPSLPAPLYHELLRKASLKGYDTALIVRTRQTGS